MLSQSTVAPRFSISPAKLKGAASDAVPADVAAAFNVTDNLGLFEKLNALRIASGRRPLTQGDLPTNRAIVKRLHRMARDIISPRHS